MAHSPNGKTGGLCRAEEGKQRPQAHTFFEGRTRLQKQFLFWQIKVWLRFQSGNDSQPGQGSCLGHELQSGDLKMPKRNMMGAMASPRGISEHVPTMCQVTRRVPRHGSMCHTMNTNADHAGDTHSASCGSFQKAGSAWLSFLCSSELLHPALAWL